LIFNSLFKKVVRVGDVVMFEVAVRLECCKVGELYNIISK